MWVQLAVTLLMMVVSAALQANAAKKNQPKPPEAGKLDIPKAEEGGTIPVIFGTCIVKQSNVVWYGDSKTQAIKTGGGGKK